MPRTPSPRLWYTLSLAGHRFQLLNLDHPEIATRVLDDLDAGRIQALLFVMKAGGEGLPMQAAGTLIRIQRPDSLLQNLQTEKRVHRIGSERHDVVLIVDIVTEDTLEVEQVAASITAVDDVWGKIDVSRQARAWQEEDERRPA